MNQPKPIRYAARVKTASGRLSSEFVDWFVDDNEARTQYRIILGQQGYQVKSIHIENQTAIVELL